MTLTVHPVIFFKIADLVQHDENKDDQVAIAACLTNINVLAETQKQRHSCLVWGYLQNLRELGSYSCLMCDLNTTIIILSTKDMQWHSQPKRSGWV